MMGLGSGFLVGPIFGLTATAGAQDQPAPELRSISPADGTVTSDPPEAIVLNFTTPVLALRNGSRLSGDDGSDIDVRLAVDLDRTTVRMEPLLPLGPGQYRVGWEVRSDDGLTRRGRSTFEVRPDGERGGTDGGLADPSSEPPSGTEANGGATAGDADGGDGAGSRSVPPGSVGPADDDGQSPGLTVLATTVRALGWMLTATASGVFIYLALVQRGGIDELHRLVIFLRRSGLLVVVVSLAEFLVTAAREEASLGAALDASVLASVAASGTGWALGFRALAGLLVAVGSYEAARPIDPMLDNGFLEPVTDARTLAPRDAVCLHVARVPVAVVGVALLVGSTVALALATGPSRGPVGVLALVVHVSAASVWMGAALGLLIVCTLRIGRGRSLRRGAVVANSARLAGIAMVATAVSGLVAGIDRPIDLFGSSAGRLLVVKSLLVVLAALALGHTSRSVDLASPPEAAPSTTPSVVAGWRAQLLIGLVATIAAALGVFV